MNAVDTPAALQVICRLKSDATFVDTLQTSNHRGTHTYIPGGAIRGALAAWYGFPGQCGVEEDEFLRVFCRGEVRFCNAYLRDTSGQRSVPVPLSVRSPKSRPGFAEDTEARGYGGYDTLIGADSDNPCGGVGLNQNAGQPNQDHGDEPRVRLAEDYCVVDQDGIRRVRPETLILMGTAVADETQTAKEGTLRSVEALASEQEFLSFIVGDATLIDGLKTRVCERGGGEGAQPHERALTVGLGNARAPGTCQLDPAETQTPDERVFFGLRSNDNAVHFILTCLSDTILLDPWLRYRQSIPAECLRSEWGGEAPAVALISHRADVRLIEGWNAGTGLPRRADLAIRKGSSFLYRVNGGDGATQALLPHLQALTHSGLGLRRAEGFGEITFAHPFYIRLREGGGVPV